MRWALGAAVAALVLPCAGASHAATIVMTYYGVVTSGGDASYNDLTGETIKAIVTIDDTRTSSEYSTRYSRIRGGSDYGTLGPVSAVVTLRGVEYRVDGSRNATASQLFDPAVHHMYQESIGSVEGLSGAEGHFRGWVIDEKGGLVPNSDYHNPVAIALRHGLVMGGSFGVTGAGGENVYVNYDARVFAVDGLPFPHVPEPSTWAMMIIGFGGAGVALRRARKQAPVPA